jgi:hypothetical protein
MMLMSMWYAILVPFFIIMMVVGNSRRNTHDSDEEIEVDNTYQGEEEGMGGDEDNENDSDGQDSQKSKERYTPLWKYVIKLSEGKGGGTGKFICHHCHTEYTGSYTRVRKHLCGSMYWEVGKNIGIKACVSIESTDRLRYQREEEVAQNKSKRPKVESENAQECSLVEAHPPMLVHSRLRLHLEHYQNFLTEVVEMMWMQTFTSFSMHVVYHSMFFTHHIGMKWSKPSMVPLKVIGAPGMTKLEPWDLTRKDPKSKVL